MKQGLVVLVAGGFGLVGLALAPAPARAQTIREVSRSSPIIATVDGVEAQYQGTYEVVTPTPPVTAFTDAASAATFEFPYTRGHLRAVDTGDIGTATAGFDASALFDAATGIPPANPAGCGANFTETCRTVFTTIEAPDASGLAQRPDRIFFSQATRDQTRSLLAPGLGDADVDTLIQLILEGSFDGGGARVSALGGIDRSTLAVVERSAFIPDIAGVPRPTMIYAGALDGMLHAICAEVLGPCTAVGQELWAFIPRTQLGALRFNTQRIDGSPRVADVFDDFDLTDGEVFRQFRTVLTLQTGSGDPGTANRQPSVLAIDISDPADPIVLWERSTPASPAVVDQGVGLGLAMGPARLAGRTRNLTFVQTNSGGTGGAGFHLAAIDTSTGEEAWPSFDHLYPAPRSGGNPPVPDSGIPGGAVAFDDDQSGFVTHVAVASLYGDLWVIESDGDLPYAGPIFRFSTDFHPIGAPPTIYFDQLSSRLHAVVVSGGYADPVAATWVRSVDDQFAVSVALDPSPGAVPMDELSGSVDDRAFAINLGSGRLSTAQAIVQGNELFVTGDKTDSNLLGFGEVADTGTLARFSLSGGTAKGSIITITGGASSTSVTSAGVVHVGSGAGAMKVDVAATGGGVFDPAGSAVQRAPDRNNRRLLWMNE
jgi:hypothetical protein